MKKKICFVLDQFLYGGIERVAINYLSVIDKNEYDIDVVILSNTEKMIEQIPKECNIVQINIPRQHNPLSRASTMVRRDAGAILYYGTYILKRLFIFPQDYIKTLKLRKVKYDTVIAFSGHMNDCYVALKFIRANYKIVWAHGMIFQYLLLSPAFEKMYKKFDKIVTINNIDQDDLFNYKPYLNYKIEKLYNPVVLNNNLKANRIDLVKKYGEYFLTVARMDEPKDFFTLIDAYEIYFKKYSKKYKLLLVGDGPDRKKIEKYIKLKKMEDNILIMGSQDDVDNFYSHAKLFILSSKTEGLPTVIIEAMSRSLPIVATDALYGCRDIIGNDEYGIIVPVGDSTMLADKINYLIKNKDVYDHYKKKSIERYKYFLPNKIIKEFYRIIDNSEKNRG